MIRHYSAGGVLPCLLMYQSVKYSSQPPDMQHIFFQTLLLTERKQSMLSAKWPLWTYNRTLEPRYEDEPRFASGTDSLLQGMAFERPLDKPFHKVQVPVRFWRDMTVVLAILLNSSLSDSTSNASKFLHLQGVAWRWTTRGYASDRGPHQSKY